MVAVPLLEGSGGRPHVGHGRLARHLHSSLVHHLLGQTGSLHRAVDGPAPAVAALVLTVSHRSQKLLVMTGNNLANIRGGRIAQFAGVFVDG